MPHVYPSDADRAAETRSSQDFRRHDLPFPLSTAPPPPPALVVQKPFSRKTVCLSGTGQPGALVTFVGRAVFVLNDIFLPATKGPVLFWSTVPMEGFRSLTEDTHVHSIQKEPMCQNAFRVTHLHGFGLIVWGSAGGSHLPSTRVWGSKPIHPINSGVPGVAGKETIWRRARSPVHKHCHWAPIGWA